MKSLGEMDLQDWEILPEDDDDGFLEIHHDGGGSKVYSRSRKPGDDDKVLQMNYFICPPIVIPKPQDHDLDDHHQIQIKIASPPPTSGAPAAVDQDNVSQVFFKKMTETEFADMKVESPKSSSKGIMKVESPKLNLQNDHAFHHQYHQEEEKVESDDHLNLNIWKWSLTGIGAICSFGIAAASVCIIILSTSNRKNKHSPKKNHKFQFQIDTNDKRIRQVVEQASKLNEVISAVRGFPVNKAHITFGGYYDAPPTVSN